MRACLLSIQAPRHMVSIAQYGQYFDLHGIPYDIICTDPYGDDEKGTADRLYKVRTYGNPSVIQKISGYVRFISYAKKVMRENHYDLIVLRNEITTILFTNFLRKYYKGKYIVSVKDLFNENAKLKNEKLLTKQLNKAVADSYLTTVSSPAFCQYFEDSGKSLLVHNISPAVIPQKHMLSKEDVKKEPIIILYCGHISYPQIACKMIDRFKNDSRFFMRIVGNGSEPVKAYADKTECKNIEVLGGFKSSETIDILNTGHIIYNVYGNDFRCEQTALSNKLYYSVCMHMPILVSPKTYMAEITGKLGVGFEIDFDSPENICDNLHDWYVNFDQEKVDQKCEDYKIEALSSHKELFKKMDFYFERYNEDLSIKGMQK